MNPNAEHIVRQLRQAGFTAYFAGGCVRDFLLQRRLKDVDIATDAQPEDVQKIFKRVTDIQGKAFGVVRVREGGEVFEIAAFRKDGVYLDGRHPKEVTFTNAEEDARRRDFTVNGLFYDPEDKHVIDFVGGQADLERHVIRAIGKPEERFAEDYLRILRAVRFAAELDFAIEDRTWDALCQYAEKTRELAVERVRDELIKCFTGSHPARALDLLDASGLLEIWLPEVSRQKGVEQPPEFHPEGDVYQHVRLMLTFLENASVELAFSVLLHDIGKPDTFKVDENGRIRFNEHESFGKRMATKLLRRLKFSNDQIDAITDCVGNHMSFINVPHMKLSTLKRFLARPHIETEMELHRIDCLGCHADLTIYDFLRAKQKELGEEEIKPPPLVTGDDVLALGIAPSPRVGQLLDAVREEQLEGKLKTREEGLVRLREFASQAA